MGNVKINPKDTSGYANYTLTYKMWSGWPIYIELHHHYMKKDPSHGEKVPKKIVENLKSFGFF